MRGLDVRLGFTAQFKTGNPYGIVFGTRPGCPQSVIIERILTDDAGNPKFNELGVAEALGLEVFVDDPIGTKEGALSIPVNWDWKSTFGLGEVPYQFSLAFPSLETVLKTLVVGRDQLEKDIESGNWWEWKEWRLRDNASIYDQVRRFLIEREASRYLLPLPIWEVMIDRRRKFEHLEVFVSGYGRIRFDAILEHLGYPSEVAAEVRSSLLRGREYSEFRWQKELDEIRTALKTELSLRIV